jgi:hypothetical protein
MECKWMIWGILAGKDELSNRVDATLWTSKAVAQSQFQAAKGDQNVYKSFVLSVNRCCLTLNHSL